MKIDLKEKLSRFDVRQIPKYVAGMIVIAATFGLVMFLRQFDIGKEEEKKD